jgi:hypothetical protein
MASLQVGATAATRLPSAILARLRQLTKFGTGHRRKSYRTPKRLRALSTMSTLVVEHYEASFYRTGGVRLTFDAPEHFRPTGDLLQLRQDDDTGCLVLVWRDNNVELLDGAHINLIGGIEVLWTANGLLRGADMECRCLQV